MVRFSAKPKNEPHSSLLRERSARKTSVFNQKTMFLGYAHSSYIFRKFDAGFKPASDWNLNKLRQAFLPPISTEFFKIFVKLQTRFKHTKNALK
ncbi:MAG: hypothetical protein U5L45_12065 [Saprospiraceae bacterium]|nr:hypothetical protein [Saprospiraceae bacterium]